MSIVGILLFLASFVTLLVSIVMMIPRSKRAVGKRNAKFAAAGVVIGLVIVGVSANKETEEKALSAGWSSSSEMREAERAGIDDPKAWAIAQEDARRVAAEAQAAASAAADAKAIRIAELTAEPTDQIAFVSAVTKSQNGYRAATTDFQKGAMRPARAASICNALSGLTIRNWIGKVTTLSTNGDGKGVISVALTDSIHLSTWNNTISDFADETLIEPGSPMYTRLGTLKNKDTVRVSGSFTRSETDCVGEQSISLAGSLTDPEFIFRFTDIAAVDLR